MDNSRPLFEYVYEENDTVYFYDFDFSEFQILYDFNTAVNDYWDIKFYDDDGGELDTVRMIVTDKDSIQINGFWLERMTVNPTYLSECGFGGGGGYILEFIGGWNNLFPYSTTDCVSNEYPYSTGLRCYDDSFIGHYEASGVNGACELIAGFEEIDNSLKLFPNPVSDVLFIQNYFGDEYEFILYNLSGEVVFETLLKESEHNIYLGHLNSGLYFYTIKDQRGKLVIK